MAARVRAMGGTVERVPCTQPVAVVLECLHASLNCGSCELNPTNLAAANAA